MNLEEKKRLSKKHGLIIVDPKKLPEEFKRANSLFYGQGKLHGYPYDKTLMRCFPHKFKMAGRILLDILNRYRTIENVEYVKIENGDIIEIPVVKMCQDRPAVLLQTKIWAEEEGCDVRTIQRQVSYLEKKEFIKTFYKGKKAYRYFHPNFDKIEDIIKKSRLELLNDKKTTWMSFSKTTQESFSYIDNSNNNNSRTSLKNSSNSYKNSISSKSVKPRLKLRKNKNQGFVSKTKSPAKTKLKLRSAAKKLKDAALYSEPVDLRKEKRKAKPIKQIPRKVQECIDHWNSSGLRKHKINFDNPTKTLQQSIKSLKQLLAGRAFRNGQEQFIEEIDPAYTKKVFSVDDWKQSVSNFAKVVTDPTYQNMCKHYGDKVSIPEFIYRHDWPTVSRPKSHFCYNLKYEPKVVQPTYRMPYLTSAPQKLYDAFLKLLADEYQTPTNTLTEEDKVFLAIFIRDFHQTLLNFYNQNKLDSVFGNLWANGSFGSYGLAEQLMKLLQSEWPGPPMSIPFGFIVNKRRIERLPGTLKKLGWMN